MIPKSTPVAANCFPVRTTVTLCDDLGEPSSKQDYITDALCVMKWLCRDRSALCVIGPKNKKDAKSLRYSNFLRPEGTISFLDDQRAYK